MHEELYTKQNFIVSNFMKALSQAVRGYIFSSVEHQNHVTVSTRWINTLFIT